MSITDQETLKEQPGESMVVLVPDGNRPGPDPSIMACMVTTEGDHWEQKTKTPFNITYEEESLASRKEQHRGIIFQVEGWNS